MASDNKRELPQSDHKGLSILVPLDGSSMAESALSAVESLAGKFQATVLLLHIIESHPPATIHGERHLSDISDAENYLKEVALRLNSSGIAVEIHVHSDKEGDVARSIVDHAGEINPDLVIMCTHGRGGLKGLLFGSIAQQAMKRGAWPILLIPPALQGTARPFGISKILIPLDNMHDYTPAFRLALPIARTFKAEIHLAWVIPTFFKLTGDHKIAGSFLPGTTQVMLEIAEKEAAEYLQQIIKEHEPEGLKLVAHVLRGDTVPEVLACAEKIDADLIVLTGHGRSGIDALLSGSIGQRIAGKAGRPLLLIRTGETKKSIGQ